MRRSSWDTCALAGLVLLASCSPAAETERASSGEARAPESAIQFVDEASTRGVSFEHRATRSNEKRMPEVLGAGVAIADFDRNGAPDLYFVGGGDLAVTERSAATRDRLYLNDGRGHFRDASAEWRVGGGGYGMGVAVGDYDNDGWPDVLLTSYGDGERLYRNTGSGFEDMSAQAGFDAKAGWGSSAGFFDADNDGDLDAYVVRYVEYDLGAALKCWHNGRHIYCSPALFDAVPDTLWRNNGDGTFTDVSVESGIAAHAANGLALALGDLDDDGDVDAFVANDITRNLLWINDGSGKFTERGATGGVAYDETGRSSAGMGADFSDVDDNDLDDIVCTNFQDETSNIYLQVAPGVFRDRAYALGVGSSAQQRLSFGVDFFDADNDGDEDLFIANGHIDDGIGSVSESVSFAQQNSLYRLDEGRYMEISDVSGSGLKLVEVSRGVASADLDGDRRLDLVLTNNSAPARLLMNRSDVAGRDAVVLWLEGKASNRSAVGARLRVQRGETVLRREVRGASSYLSQCDTRVHIGLNAGSRLEGLEILWPSGAQQTIGELAPGFYHCVEGEEPRAFTPGEKVLPPR